MASDEEPLPVRELPVSPIDLNLLAAVKRNDAVAVYQNIRNGANVNCVHSETDTSPLVEACDQGCDAIVRILLDAGADARQKIGEFGRTAVFHACHEGNLPIVEMLINHDHYLLDIASYHGHTPLYWAIAEGHVDVVRFLIDRGANVHATDVNGDTTLMAACQCIGDLAIMRLLLAAGVDVEARGRHQKTALHHAAHCGKREAVQELVLQHNANMCAMNSNQETPFDDVVNSGVSNDVVLDCLLEMHGNRLTQDHGRLALHAILRAAEYSFEYEESANFFALQNDLIVTVPLGMLNFSHFRTLLHYLDTELIRNRDHSGQLPIHIACQTKAPVDVLSVLGKLDMATLHMADHRGNLALHKYCHGREVDHSCVLFLVEHGGVGTLAARNHQGALPLHRLCGSTHPSLRTVQYLIQSFPESVEARTNMGQYPFMIAASETSTASLSVIYELVRADPAVVVTRQKHPVTQIDLNLLAAIICDDAAAVQQNIRNGANVNSVHCDRSHYTMHTTPLMKACRQGCDAIVRILLDAGADARQNDDDKIGTTAVYDASYEGQVSIVEMLINHDNYLLDIVDNYGQTPLYCAIMRDNADVVRFLIDRGANVHATDVNGDTTLMAACRGIGDLAIMRLLLAAGVDAEARDRTQKTALHHAAMKGKLEAVQELVLQHNANMCAMNSNQETPFDAALNSRVSNRAALNAVLDSLLAMHGKRLTQDHGRLAFHAILRAATYSFEYEEEDEFSFAPQNDLLVTVPLGMLNFSHFRSLMLSLDTELIRNRDHSGQLPIHVACQTKTPVDVLSVLVKLDMAALHMADHRGNLALHECCRGAGVDHSSVLFLVEQGGVGTLAARNHDQGALPLHVLCGSTHPSLGTVQYLIQSFPRSVVARTNSGQYPFMIAASETSTASLSVIYELVRADAGVVIPRPLVNG